MKKVILGVCITLMLLIWPICFFRRSSESTSTLNGDYYAVTEQALSEDYLIEQSFQPVTSRIENISFVVFYEEVPENSGLLFEFLDDNEKVLVEKYIDCKNIESNTFVDVDIHKWVNRHHTYRFRLSANKDAQDKIYLMYTRGGV